MFFQLLRRGTKRKSYNLHTLTVIESQHLGFAVGPLLAQVTGRTFFDLRLTGTAPRVSNKVVSVLNAPKDGSKTWGLLIDVDEIIKNETQVSSQSVLRLVMLHLKERTDPWN